MVFLKLICLTKLSISSTKVLKIPCLFKALTAYGSYDASFRPLFHSDRRFSSPLFSEAEDFSFVALFDPPLLLLVETN